MGCPTCVLTSVGGRAATFLVGRVWLCGVRFFIHIRVYESSTGKEKNVAPPTVRSCEQVAVASFLLADTFG